MTVPYIHVFIDVLYSLCLYLVPIKRAIDTSNFLITFNHLFRHDPSQGTHVWRIPSVSSKYFPNSTSSSSNCALPFGTSVMTIIAPTTQMPEPTRKMACCPLSVVAKRVSMRGKTCVPTAAPALSIAAAKPRAWPLQILYYIRISLFDIRIRKRRHTHRTGVGNDTDETMKLQLPGPTERKHWKRPNNTTKAAKAPVPLLRRGSIAPRGRRKWACWNWYETLCGTYRQ